MNNWFFPGIYPRPEKKQLPTPFETTVLWMKKLNSRKELKKKAVIAEMLVAFLLLTLSLMVDPVFPSGLEEIDRTQ